MGRFRVDPKLVREVRTKDGTRYRPDQNGYVGIAHRHERELERSDARSDHHEARLEPVRLTVPGFRGKTCPVCQFEAWPWARTCGRCRTAL